MMRATRVLLTVACGTALALFTLEGVSRWYLNYVSVQDPVLGAIVPAGYTVRSRIEGSGVAHYEDRGVRRAADMGPRPGAPILCLGDSFTEAYQVSDEDVYTTLVERSLNRAGVPATVLNFGKSDASVADYVAHSQAYETAFTPIWTVVQVHDRDFTSEAWEPWKNHFRQRCNTCSVEVVPITPAPENAVRRTMRWLRNRSALTGFGGTRLLELVIASRQTREAAGAAELRSAKPTSTNDFPVTEELRMLADAYDGHLTVLLLGSFDPARPSRDTDGEAAVKRAAREAGISLASSKDEYAALAEEGIAPHGFSNTALNDGHMNAAGHAAAARVLTRELLRLHAEGRL
jgi:hypothetical protein